MKRFEADLLATWAITMPLHSTLLQVCYALFCQGICRAGGPARAKRGLATDPAAAAAGRSPPGGDLGHVPEGRGLVSKPMYHVYFFIYRIDQCAGGTVSRIVHFSGSGSCCSSL